MIPLPVRWRPALDTAIAALAAAVVAIFAVMVALVLVQVFDRFLGFGWFWTEEVVRALLVWSVMLGLPVVLYRFDEVVVEILPMGVTATRWRLRLAAALTLIFLIVLAWQGWQFAARNAGFALPTLGISRGWIYAPIPVGSALGCLALLIRDEERSPSWPVEAEPDTNSGDGA